MNILRAEMPTEVWDEISQVPYLKTLLWVDGLYLAGGCLRTILGAEEELLPNKTDIDLFFRDSNVLNSVKTYLEEATDWVKVYQCPDNRFATYKHKETGWKLQCISFAYYESVPQLLSTFDFTVTMFGTDGEFLYLGETSLQDADALQLKFNVITYPASTLRRMMKYAKKGYHMIESDYQFFTEKLWNHDPNVIDAQLVYVD